METLANEINWALIAPLVVIQALLLLIAFIDLVKGSDTRGPKWMWVFIIIFVSIIGPVLYFVIGRRQH